MYIFVDNSHKNHQEKLIRSHARFLIFLASMKSNMNILSEQNIWPYKVHYEEDFINKISFNTKGITSTSPPNLETIQKI